MINDTQAVGMSQTIAPMRLRNILLSEAGFGTPVESGKGAYLEAKCVARLVKIVEGESLYDAVFAPPH